MNLPISSSVNTYANARRKRSFSTHMCLISRTVFLALSDPQVFSNFGWTFNRRGDPAGADFLKVALPVTGKKHHPQSNPFEEPGTYSINEERALDLSSLASLPNRQGFFWSLGKSKEAIKITTARLELPHSPELGELLSDPLFGKRVSRVQYAQDVAARNKKWRQEDEPMLPESLTESYRCVRGGD